MENEEYSELRSELMEWKGRMETVLVKFDTLSCDDKERVLPYVNDVTKIVGGLSDKMKSLLRHCSTEFPSYSGEWAFESGGDEKQSDDVMGDLNPT
jgi:hypothetical protein